MRDAVEHAVLGSAATSLARCRAVGPSLIAVGTSPLIAVVLLIALV